jgi:two-component system C4-dicarboxylate transport response regulator DctD
MNAVLSYSWPGNVRELRNVAERYVLLGEHNDWSIDRVMPGAMNIAPSSLARQVEMFERSMIEQALSSSSGSIKEVMKLLSIPRKTLSDKMRKYQLNKNDYK